MPYILILFISLLMNPTMLEAQEVSQCISGNCNDGFGKYVWHSGERYVGNWKDHKMHGHGVFYWPGGRKYVGQWAFGKFHGKGSMFYENGNIKVGLWEANRFVELEREDYVLSEKNLIHGKNQIRQMLLDRPHMRHFVQEGDTIWNWMSKKFAGEDIAYKIYWRKESSEDFIIPSGVKAAHSYPTATKDGQIWVEDSQNLEEMWSSVIYELFNITNFEAFDAVEKDAMYGKCDKETYIMRYAELEYYAALRTAQFYHTVWKPYAQKKGQKTTPSHWFANIPNTFEEWIGLYTDKEGYPWNPYAAYYDALIIETIRKY